MRATLVGDFDNDNTRPGSFVYFEHEESDHAGILYVCPCGRGVIGSLCFIKIDNQQRA